jgi:hypothetical protein
LIVEYAVPLVQLRTKVQLVAASFSHTAEPEHVRPPSSSVVPASSGDLASTGRA